MPEEKKEKIYKLGGYRFTQRDIDLIRNCRDYAFSNPAGLPGHNLMLIIAKLVVYYDFPHAALTYDPDDQEETE